MESPKFSDLSLSAPILDAINEMGFETPTPIQAGSIPPLLQGRDIVGIAQTGTGKTAAFGLPLLSLIDAEQKHVQAVVLAPTRELAMQSATAIESFAKYLPISVVTVYGGSSYTPQIRALKAGAQIVVGTPGRIIDLINKDYLKLQNVRVLVLDEADEMLRMGFAEDVETIAASMPESQERVNALFSATMPPAIQKVADAYLTDPVRVEVAPQASTADNLEQTYAVVPFKHKLGALGRVLATRDEDAAIVFVRTRSDVDEVSADMTRRGFKTAGISGDVSQNERERIMRRLRDGSLDVLVATDVAARGLDVDRIGLVVNFDVPREAEAYVHRVGRTGRAGRSGRSLTFFTPRERGRLRKIEKLTGTPMTEVAIPTPREVSAVRARRLLDKLPGRLEAGRLELYYDLINEITDTGELDLDDLAAALLAQAIGDLGRMEDPERRGSGRIRREEVLDEDGNFVVASFEEGRDKPKKAKNRGAGRIPESGFRHRYRVEVGHKDNVKPGAIVGAITNEGGVDGKDLGRIDIFPTFSLVDMALPLTDDAQRKIGRATISGRQLRIKKDRGPSRRNHESADRRESRHRDRRAGEEEPFENRRDGKTFRDKKRRLGKRSRDFASHSRGRNGFKRKRFH
ncbi:DEAD/DEAH box helicase [Gleimia europaea]|uniref:DEAD/DEAH box helicase n=1 Tax=Gleimia europaea TaxID=66228 RepID=UPI002659B395|nr:DEAD/DEAH box helicase [Gleimia europaea]MDK7143784.1 DEAD/DEAH box helicase [Gleimia europaea]